MLAYEVSPVSDYQEQIKYFLLKTFSSYPKLKPLYITGESILDMKKVFTQLFEDGLITDEEFSRITSAL